MEKKNNTLKIVLTVIGIVIFAIIGIIVFVFSTIRTIKNNQYKHIYCNDDCYYYDGNTIKHYFSPEDPSIILGEYDEEYSCKYKSDGCREVYEYNDDYLIYQSDEDLYIYYKHPYKPSFNTKELKLENEFYTDGITELYVYPNNTMVVASKEAGQTKGEITVDRIGKDRFYELYFYYSDGYDIEDRYPITSFIYDSKENTFVGYKKADIKDAKYLKIDNYDKDGKIKLTEEDYKKIYGKYKIDEEILEISDKTMYSNKNGKIQKIKYEIIDSDEEYYYIENDGDRILAYDKKGNKICEYDYDEDDYQVLYCYDKIS